MNKPSLQVYRRLLRYSRPYYGRIGLAMLGSLAVAGVDVASAQLVRPLVDKVLGAGNYYLVNFVPFIIIGLALIKGGGRYVQEYFIKTAGQLVVQDIRNDLYEHSMGLSMRYYSRNTTGGVMSRILNDVGMLQRSAADVLVETVREVFALIGLTASAFYSDWKLACVAFVVLPAAIVPASVIGRKIKDYTRRSQATMASLTAVLQESIAGIKVIKAFGTEWQENNRFRAENLAFYKFIRKTLKYDSISAPAIELLGSLGIAGVFWYGLHRVISGAITQGELFAFGASVLLMYGPVKRLTKVSNTMQRSVGAAERVFETLDEVPEIRNATDAVPLVNVKGEVIFDRITFSYDEEPVLKDFSLVARPGEVVALVGPSGAGKSTVSALLARFYDPQEGSVSIDGMDLRKITLESLKNQIALVDQETFLFNDTISNNISYGRRDASDELIKDAARKAFAEEFILEMPAGFDSRIGDRGVRLSGGQRQRLCIARAILRDAPILILDEATSALDSESEAAVQLALNNLMKNRTTFVIAHRLSTIINADKIVVIEDGRIQDIGPHQELLQRCSLYQKLCAMQFRDME
ncbi:ABC transporter ATP-binding protein [Malonomonas rubra]|uniref:ABC transporter ATP-binding protein n=1 Tax=Malonomonas rubra TaxID=57040 RepID=UPI0026F365D5|nr:ABC transporter transmembrane domain-containing protein [Malonomonas rubra]